MQHLEDITPHEFQHAAIPNATVDDLTGRNLLALAVLTNFIRHTGSYGLTVGKLTARCGGQGETAVSRAYNTCIDAGYMGRIEFTYERPKGSDGRSGLRASHGYVSRVPLNDEQFAQLVASYTPGKFVFTPVKSGDTDENGRPVYEQRRVRVLAAEVYCHLGAMAITRDGLLSEHSGRWRGNTTRPSSHEETDVTTTEHAEADGDEPAAPEPGFPGSGVTSTNTVFSQVAPEPGLPGSGKPGSNNKTNENTKEDQPAAASLRSLATWHTPPQAPGCTTSETGNFREHGETTTGRSARNHPPARAGSTGTAPEDGTEEQQFRSEEATTDERRAGLVDAVLDAVATPDGQHWTTGSSGSVVRQVRALAHEAYVAQRRSHTTITTRLGAVSASAGSVASVWRTALKALISEPLPEPERAGGSGERGRAPGMDLPDCRVCGTREGEPITSRQVEVVGANGKVRPVACECRQGRAAS